MSSPSWYDLLGVAPDATPSEIKAAWRDATDKFEPGSGSSQFSLFNEAADVLLNPQKRNAYDAELAGGVRAGTTDPTVEVDPVKTVPAPSVDDQDADGAGTEVEAAPVPSEYEAAVAAAESAEDAQTGRSARLRELMTSTVALAVVGVLAVASLAFATVVFIKTDLGEKADEYKAGRNAAAAAVSALSAVLSYDYRQLDTPAKLEASLNAVTANMTPDLAERYRTAFTTVCRPDIDSPATAVDRKSIVTSAIEDPAVIDAGTDRVRLLVFVSQTTSNKFGGPNSRASQVVATMARKGDRWLLETVEPKGQAAPACVEPDEAQAPSTP